MRSIGLVDASKMLINHLFLILITAYIGSAKAKFSIIIFCQLLLVMGNSLKTGSPLPISTTFKLPSPLPAWPEGGDFATGVVDLGGLQVRKITTFQKIWETQEGGPENVGVTCFEPSAIPDGYSMLGSYAQPNNQPLFGWILVGKTDASDQSGDILKQPTGYTLLSTQASSSKGSAYFWLPTPPDGYKAVGLVLTASPEKPSDDKIRCVRSDFTDELERDRWIWGQGAVESAGGMSLYGLRPKNRGTKAQQLSVGTFVIENSTTTTSDGNYTIPLSCLKKKNSSLSAVPNISQIEALVKTYSPYIYFHPKETYFPSSVNWYFSNGALLYKTGEESNPIPIEPNGSNLPQGGSNDGSYWLDLPVNQQEKERVKKGDLQSAEGYIHVKPVLGATFTDIQIWLFYPFNGPATAKLGIIEHIPLGKIGEHVGDWEHVTLRISNFDGILYKVYLGQHSTGTWVDSCLLKFREGNKFVGYSARNGHGSYYKEEVVLQGGGSIGIRNDTEKSDMVMDTGAKFTVVAADGVVEPPWLNYTRKWGPKIEYDRVNELERVERLVPTNLKSSFQSLVNALPNEVYGEDGPTGPKMKNFWDGDER
ncbi:hypothetical protein ACS0TY_011802 [Phlomoides rotata]